MTIERINPEGMHANPAFSQGIVVPATMRLLFIGGQNAVNAKGEVVGAGDVAAQAGQAIDNLLTVLTTAGGTLDDLVEISILLAQGADLYAAYGAWMARSAGMSQPPTVNFASVAGLARPEYLIEVKAIAALK